MRDSSPEYKIGSRSPCTGEGCLDQDYDFDPCGSNEDITDKDWAVILKEENAKVKNKLNDVQNVDETTRRKLKEAGNVEGARNKFSSKGKLKEVGSVEDGKIKRRLRESVDESARSVKNIQKEKGQLGEERKETETETEEEGSEDEEEVKKKRICKRFIKNPFFTNRLKFSSDLPPRPATPPPQSLPPLDEFDSGEKLVCTKQKRKCKRKKEDKGGKEKKDELYEKYLRFESGSEISTAQRIHGSVREDKKEEKKDEEEEGKDVGSKEMKIGDEDDDGEGKRKEIRKVGVDKGEEGKKGSKDEDGRLKEERRNLKHEREKEKKKMKEDLEKAKKKHCKKKSERPLCKRKVSDISVSLLPPQIPPLQRDLPETSPKDIPEVERQLLFSCGGIIKKRKKQSAKCKTK